VPGEVCTVPAVRRRQRLGRRDRRGLRRWFPSSMGMGPLRWPMPSWSRRQPARGAGMRTTLVGLDQRECFSPL